MTQRIENLKSFIRSNKHHVFRRDAGFPGAERFVGMPHMERVTQALCDMLSAETPVVLPEEKILFWRTVTKIPESIFNKQKAYAEEQINFEATYYYGVEAELYAQIMSGMSLADYASSVAESYTIEDIEKNPQIMEDFMAVMRDTSERDSFVERNGDYCLKLLKEFEGFSDLKLVYYDKELDRKLQAERLQKKGSEDAGYNAQQWL